MCVEEVGCVEVPRSLCVCVCVCVCLCVQKKAMRQRILGSHTPPCHRRMVIIT